MKKNYKFDAETNKELESIDEEMKSVSSVINKQKKQINEQRKQFNALKKQIKDSENALRENEWELNCLEKNKRRICLSKKYDKTLWKTKDICGNVIYIFVYGIGLYPGVDNDKSEYKCDYMQIEYANGKFDYMLKQKADILSLPMVDDENAIQITLEDFRQVAKYAYEYGFVKGMDIYNRFMRIQENNPVTKKENASDPMIMFECKISAFDDTYWLIDVGDKIFVYIRHLTTSQKSFSRHPNTISFDGIALEHTPSNGLKCCGKWYGSAFNESVPTVGGLVDGETINEMDIDYEFVSKMKPITKEYFESICSSIDNDIKSGFIEPIDNFLKKDNNG